MATHSRHAALAAALAGLAGLLGAAAVAAQASVPAGIDAATEAVRQRILEDDGGADWGADPPGPEIAERGEPIAATVLGGAGHAMLAFGSDGRPMGSHLWLLHVSMEGAGASATECVLRLGRDDERSCPPAPLSLLDCATWSVPVEAARAALVAARGALFVRVHEKAYIAGPREERLDDGEVSGVIGGIEGGTTVDFVAVAHVVEAGRSRIRVAEEWAGYRSSHAVGRYARVAVAKNIVLDAFERPRDAPASAPPPAAHAEFSRLFATLPLDDDSWWWVRERMVLMAGGLGEPADLARLEGYLAPKAEGFLKPKGNGPSEIRTRAYALEALARRTQRDTRCEGSRRLDDHAAAAAWLRSRSTPGPKGP